MGKLEFTSNSSPTVGIEVELGLVDLQTMLLTNRIGDLLEHLGGESQTTYKPEFLQSFIEVNTDVCHTIDEAQQDLKTKLTELEVVCDGLGLGLWWGATHPLSNWRDQKVTENQRYYDLLNLLQEMARRMVTFGLHVHVGVDSGDKAIMICDRIMQHLPLLLALSCSSPFWGGRNTGLQSNRTKVVEGLPTAGLPPHMRNWSEFTWIVNHMIDTHFINTIREIWWDVRPHHKFGTVEVRVCDMPGNLHDVLALSALIQCLVATLSDMIDEGTYQLDCHPMMVRQNKWRGCRYGHEATLVDSFTFKTRSVTEATDDLLQKIEPTSRKLGCESWLAAVREMARGPSWADRQIALLEKHGNHADMIRELVAQSRISQPLPG